MILYNPLSGTNIFTTLGSHEDVGKGSGSHEDVGKGSGSHEDVGNDHNDNNTTYIVREISIESRLLSMISMILPIRHAILSKSHEPVHYRCG
jgi:hypothetical protein